MNTYIAFLRGINVSGQKKFPKAEQEQLFGSLGFEKCRVYIHTGNIIFRASEEKEALTTRIAHAIQEAYGWEVPVLVKTPSEIEAILLKCPFSEEKKAKSYFIMLHNAAEPDRIKALEMQDFPCELFTITEECIYLFSDAGYGKAKCNNNFFEQKLKVTATTRNYNTMNRLLELSS